MTGGVSDIDRAEGESPPSAHRPQRLAVEKRRVILGQLFFKRKTRLTQLAHYFTLLAISVVIAVSGLLTNSTAVVIAAMLISPLMTSILGIAAAIAMGWPRRQLQQLLLVTLSVALVIGLGMGLPWLFNVPRDLTLPDEVLAWTHPGLADLLVALSAGVGAAYMLIRREALSALPGAAIAVSLVPPLGAAGILLHFGETPPALRALLLFATNFAAIVLTACAVFLAFGFRARNRALRTRLRIAPGVVLAAVLGVAAAVPLIGHTMEQFRLTRERQTATGAVLEWAGPAVIEIQDLEIKEDLVEIALILDVPFTAAAESNQLAGLVPPGMTLARLQEMISRQLEREVEIILRGQFRLVAMANDGQKVRNTKGE
jgi:uncharacterized hydrophobic protein (TIGR00271 family)